jgi:hypothetical protein
VNFLNYFPNSTEEKELLQFIAKYQYLKTTNAPRFFVSKKYYRNRVNNLISKSFLRKTKLYLVLDKLGIEYIKLLGSEYNKLNRNVKYLPRLLYISDLASFYYKCDKVLFTPSFSMKDNEVYTLTARRYIGTLKINGIEYLTYHISQERDYRYIASVMYDIQKERFYKNIIILTNDISRIHTNDFSFGLNKVLIIEDNILNREKLKYLNNIDWSRIIQENYNNKVHLSEYSFCDYTDNDNCFLSLFSFFDTEKITHIKYFLRENHSQKVDIICNVEIVERLRKELPTANYIVINLDKYMDKEINIYD